MPATSPVNVANMALRILGASAIVAFNEGTKIASAVDEVFDTERDALLRAHEWNFATKRARLGRLTAAPTFGPASQFQLPPDCLRVLSVDPDQQWAVEGRTIVVDGDTLSIRYTARIEDPTQWDAMFTKALAASIAMALCYAVTEMASMIDRATAAFDRAMGNARTTDSQEKAVESAIGASPLVDTRRTGAWLDEPWNNKWA